jgi:hypothetical protein
MGYSMIVFDEHGLLKPGEHDKTLNEVESYFGAFQRSDRRPRLFAKLREFVLAVRAVSTEISLIIDGSFVMKSVDEPNDIDLIIILPQQWDFSEDLPPFKYNVVSKKMVKRLFGFDVLVARAGGRTEATYLEFFSRVNVKWVGKFGVSAGMKKGLVRCRND